MSSSNRTTTTDALAITAHPPSKRPRTTANHGPRRIVPEHEYSQGLSQVIQQQYFPDLPHLQKALTNGEGEGESESDLTDNLPVATDQEETVTEYHARVTSEDNADFDQIQRREFQQRQTARIQQALEYYAPPKTVARPDSARALASDAFDPSPHRPPMLTNREDLAHLATQQNTLMMFPASTASKDLDGSNSQQLLTNGSTNSSDNATTIPTTTAQQADGDLMPPPASTQPRIEPSATRFPRSEKDSLRTIIQQQQQKQNQLSNHRPRAWSTSLESDVEGDHSSMFSTDDESGGAASDLDATPLRSIDSERRQYQQHRQTQPPYGMVVDHNSTTNNLRRRSVFAATPLTHRDQAAATALERIHERGRRAAAAAKGSSSAKRKITSSANSTRRGPASSSSRSSTTSSSLSSRLQQHSSSRSRRPSSSRMSNSFGSALRASYLRPSSSSKF